ncbi:MAG: cysteine desulfurase [Candidatus Nitrosocosmicus sp.]|nr:cysteine desulfurase [Candidatus Nitrosocosmicus sp.]MDN5865780.1 cysteine desulfurase [Candidatus Nitrosocosmicus sp.]
MSKNNRTKTKEPIYLDNASSSPIDIDVINEMLPFLTGYYGNPSSLHALGRKSAIAVSKARVRISKLIGSKSNEIYFTSGGTESNNLALIGCARLINNIRPTCKRILISKIEHDSIIETVKFIEKDLEFDIDYVPIKKDGLIDLDIFSEMVSPKTSLISIMLANNEIGTIQPIRALVEIAKSKNNSTIFHSDAVQAVGKIPINVTDLKIDVMTVSSHKINGPKGIGALFIKQGIHIKPIIFGGGQEMNLRSGTENVSAIVGFGKACEIWNEKLETVQTKIKELQRYMIDRIIKEIPGSVLNGSMENRISNNVNFSFAGINGEDILIKLDEHGIEASTGSACSSNKKQKASHVLKSLGLTYDQVSGSIRFSIGHQNTQEELKFVVDTLKNLIKEFRKLNGVGFI